MRARLRWPSAWAEPGSRPPASAACMLPAATQRAAVGGFLGRSLAFLTTAPGGGVTAAGTDACCCGTTGTGEVLCEQPQPPPARHSASHTDLRQSIVAPCLRRQKAEGRRQKAESRKQQSS